MFSSAKNPVLYIRTVREDDNLIVLLYVKDRMLSNCPQYSFRQTDNKHRESLKENIRNTFW